MRFFTDGTKDIRAGGEALHNVLWQARLLQSGAGLSLSSASISPRNVHKLLLRLSISSVYSWKVKTLVAARLAAGLLMVSGFTGDTRHPPPGGTRLRPQGSVSNSVTGRQGIVRA